jgi:hypothetical protein
MNYLCERLHVCAGAFIGILSPANARCDCHGLPVLGAKGEQTPVQVLVGCGTFFHEVTHGDNR